MSIVKFSFDNFKCWKLDDDKHAFWMGCCLNWHSINRNWFLITYFARISIISGKHFKHSPHWNVIWNIFHVVYYLRGILAKYRMEPRYAVACTLFTTMIYYNTKQLIIILAKNTQNLSIEQLSFDSLSFSFGHRRAEQKFN